MRRHARVPLVVNPTLQLSAVVEASRRGIGRQQLEIVDEDAVRFLLTTLVGGRPNHVSARRCAGACARPGCSSGLVTYRTTSTWTPASAPAARSVQRFRRAGASIQDLACHP
jgi:hypothetical protein